MSRRVTRKLAGATVAALVILVPAPAFAGPGSGGGGGSGGSVDGVLSAHVTYQTNGSSGGDGCSWERIDGELGVPSMGSATFPFVDENGVTQILWRRICPSGAVDWFFDPPDNPGGHPSSVARGTEGTSTSNPGADVRDARPGERLGVRHRSRRLPGWRRRVAHGVGDSVDRSGLGDRHGSARADDVSIRVIRMARGPCRAMGADRSRRTSRRLRERVRTRTRMRRRRRRTTATTS